MKSDQKLPKLLFLIFLLSLSLVSALVFPVDVSRDLVNSSDELYAYENTNDFFSVWYGDDPSSGNVVKFQAEGVTMTLLPQALNWNNDLSQIEQISMPQSVSPNTSGTDITYPDAYGSGIHLTYLTQQDKVKENLIIDSRSDLPDPASYVIAGGNPILTLGFQLTSSGKIYIDDEEWNELDDVETTNDVVVTDSEDNVVYTLPRPYAIDSANATVYAHYLFRESANKLYVRIHIPFSWLNDTARVYPVRIDPTFQVDYSPIPAMWLQNLDSDLDPDSSASPTQDVTAGVSDMSDSTTYNVVLAPSGDVLVGHWNMEIYTNYSDFNFFLYVRKSNGGGSGTVYIYPYYNNDSINTTYYNTAIAMAGSGWYNYDVKNLIQYEYGWGSPAIQLRFFTQLTSDISEMYLRVEGNDTTPPTVNYCSVNTSSLTCEETALLSCNVTDNFGVSYVTFTVDDDENMTERDEDIFSFIFYPDGNNNYTANWTEVFSVDAFGQNSSYDPNLTIDYYCCVENWQPNPINCLTNDSYLLTYYDAQNCSTYDDVPANNGTYQYCNYCSEDLLPIYGECQHDSDTRSVDWHDENVFSCCLITGLPTDCSILIYPYNETTYEDCHYFNNTMGDILCQNEPNFNLREKEYCLSYIPTIYLNETFRCISHVRLHLTEEIMQTNPEYRERAESLLDWKQDPETREWFTPAGSIVNFYYTQKNLIPENEYVLTIECSSPQRKLQSGMLFQMAYEDYEFVFFRTRWLMTNAGYIIAGIIVLLIILFVLFAVWRAGTI